MSKLLRELLQILVEEKSIYEKLLELSKQKNNVLVEGHVVELDAIVKLELEQIDKARDIEKKRISKNAEFALSLSLDPEKFDFAALREVMPVVQRALFEKFEDEFSKLLSEQSRLNKINGKLIGNMLDYIEFSVNAMTQNDIISNQYGHDGQTNTTANELSRLRLVDLEI